MRNVSRVKGVLFVSIVHMLLFNAANAQLDTPTWSRTIGGAAHERAYAIVNSFDGGYFLAGTTESYGAGLEDSWFVKCDPNGQTEWRQTVGGSGYDWSRSAIQTADGGYIAVGGTQTSSNGWSDAWIVKLSNVGRVQWSKRFGGDGADEAYCISPVSSGGYVVAGKTTSFDAQAEDGWLFKIDDNGGTLWTALVGGPLVDELYWIDETETGEFVGCGITGTSPNFDMWLVKFSATGDIVWETSIGQEAGESAAAGCIAADGGYLLVGYTRSYGAGDNNWLVVKTNDTGAVQWSRTFGGRYSDIPRAVTRCTQGGYLVSGTTESDESSGDIWVLKLSEDGSMEREFKFGGTSSDDAAAIQMVNSQEFVVAGSTESFGGGMSDFWLIYQQEAATTTADLSDRHQMKMSVYPNPLNSSAVVELELMKDSEVAMSLYDITGRLAGHWAPQVHFAGRHQISLSAESLASGTYFLHSTVDGKAATSRLVIQR